MHRLPPVTTETTPRPHAKRVAAAIAALLVCTGLTACQGNTDIKATPATASASAPVRRRWESFVHPEGLLVHLRQEGDGPGRVG